jgi:uncharacterized protein (DUF433 family)
MRSTELVTKTPNVLGGRPVFRGTRVPVETLFVKLSDRLSITEIATAYDSLDRQDVLDVLALACTLVKDAADELPALDDLPS